MSARDRLVDQALKAHGDEKTVALRALVATKRKVDGAKVSEALNRLVPKIRAMRSKIEKQPRPADNLRPDGRTKLRVAEHYVDTSPSPDVQTVAAQTAEGLAAASSPDGRPDLTEAYKAFVLGATALKSRDERTRLPHPSYFEDRIERIKSQAQVRMKFDKARVTFGGRLLSAGGILVQGGLTIGANVVLNSPQMASKFAPKTVGYVQGLNPAVLTYLKMSAAGLVFDVMTVGSAIVWENGPHGPVPLRKRFLRALLKTGLKHATLLIPFVVATPGVVGFGTAMIARCTVSLATGAVTKVLDVTVFAPTPEEAVHQAEMAAMRGKLKEREDFENLVASLRSQPLEHQKARSARMEVVYTIVDKSDATVRPFLRAAADQLYGKGKQVAMVAGLAGVVGAVAAAMFPALAGMAYPIVMSGLSQLATAPMALAGSILTGMVYRMVPMMMYRGQMWVLNMLVSWGVAGFIKLLQVTGAARTIDTAWSPLRRGLAAFAYSTAGQELSDMIKDLSIVHILGTLLRTIGYSAATGCARYTTITELFSDTSVYGRALAKNSLIDALSGRSSLGIMDAVGSTAEFGNVVDAARAIRDATSATVATKWTQYQDKGCAAFAPGQIPEAMGQVPDGTLLFGADHQPVYKVFSDGGKLRFTDPQGNPTTPPGVGTMRDLVMDYTLLETDRDVPVDRLTIGMKIRTSSAVHEFKSFEVTKDGLVSTSDRGTVIPLESDVLAGQHFLQVNPGRVTNSDAQVFVKFQPETLMRRVMSELLDDTTMQKKLSDAGIDGKTLKDRLTAREKDDVLRFHDELTQFKKTAELAAGLLDLDTPVPAQLGANSVCSREEIRARERTISTKPPPAVVPDGDTKIYLGGRSPGAYDGVQHPKYASYLDGLLCMRLRMDHEKYLHDRTRVGQRDPMDTSEWTERQEMMVARNTEALGDMYNNLDAFFADVNKGTRQRQLKSAAAHLSQSRWAPTDMTPVRETMRQTEQQHVRTTAGPKQTRNQQQQPPPGSTSAQGQRRNVRVTNAAAKVNAMRVTQATRQTRVAMIKSALDVLQDVTVQQQIGQTLGLTLATMIGFFDEMGALEAGKMMHQASLGNMGPREMQNPDLKGKVGQQAGRECTLLEVPGQGRWRLIDGDDDGTRFADLPQDEQDRMIGDCGYHKGFMSVIVGVGLSAVDVGVRAGVTALAPMISILDPTGYLPSFLSQGSKHAVVWVGIFLTEKMIDGRCSRADRCMQDDSVPVDDCPPGNVTDDDIAQAKPDQKCALLLALSKSLVDAETVMMPLPEMASYTWYRCDATSQHTTNILKARNKAGTTSYTDSSGKKQTGGFYDYDYNYDADGLGAKAYKFLAVHKSFKSSHGVKAAIDRAKGGAAECRDVSFELLANPVLKGKIYMNNIIKSTTNISTEFISEGPWNYAKRFATSYVKETAKDKAFSKAGEGAKWMGLDTLLDNDAVKFATFYQTRAKQRAKGMRMHYHTSTLLESSITSLLADRDEFKDRDYYTMDMVPDTTAQELMTRDLKALLKRHPDRFKRRGKTAGKIVQAAAADMDVFVEVRKGLQDFRKSEALRSVEESDTLMGGLGTFNMLGTMIQSGGASILIGDKAYSHPGRMYAEADDLGVGETILEWGDTLNGMTGGHGVEALKQTAEGVDYTVRMATKAQKTWDAAKNKVYSAWPFSEESLWW